MVAESGGGLVVEAVLRAFWLVICAVPALGVGEEGEQAGIIEDGRIACRGLVDVTESAKAAVAAVDVSLIVAEPALVLAKKPTVLPSLMIVALPAVAWSVPPKLPKASWAPLMLLMVMLPAEVALRKFAKAAVIGQRGDAGQVGVDDVEAARNW